MNIARGDQVGYGHPFEFAVLCIGHDLREVVQLQLVSQNDVVCAVSRVTEPVSRIKMLKRSKEPCITMTPEELDAYNAYQRKQQRKRLASMTLKELDALREYRREYARKRRARMTPAQLDAQRRYQREYHRKWRGK